MKKDFEQFPIINKKETAERLTYFMQRQHLKPTDIQIYLGLACVQTVYRWLEGINIPSIDNLYALSQLFCVKIDNMIAGSRKFIEEEQPYNQYLRLLTYHMKLRNVIQKTVDI